MPAKVFFILQLEKAKASPLWTLYGSGRSNHLKVKGIMGV